MTRKGLLLTALMVAPFSMYAQKEAIGISFEQKPKQMAIISGEASIVNSPSYERKALSMTRGTIVEIPLNLMPKSLYKVTAWLKTESGTDNVSIEMADANVSSAKANWTQVEFTAKVSAKKDALLRLQFDKQQNGRYAYIDEISVKRIGSISSNNAKGFTTLKKREVVTDLGITMQPDEKIKWMLDDKLGMFIHWGLYAGPARGEWVMENKGISIDEYRKLAYPESGNQYFDAMNFNADKWTALAKKAGFRYCNLTTQHHDGYALFETKYMTAWGSKQTHNRDFVKDYVEACRKAGLKVGLYKTLINWRYPGYYDIYGNNCKKNKFGYTTASWHKANARLMKEELYCQVRELMSNYGKIDQLFWDGGWIAQQGTDADGIPFWESGKYLSGDNQWQVNSYFQVKDSISGKPLGLMGMVRQLQPDIVVNPRSGWIGDYTCEEGGSAVKGEIRSGVVEKCMSLTPTWGYSDFANQPNRITSLNKIKKICSDCMVRNMCFLINVGPDRHGDIPPLIEQRLTEFGQWVNKNAQAIYGTRGGPWQPVENQYGFTYKGNTIYLYLLGDYTKSQLTLPSLDKGYKVRKVLRLNDKKRLGYSQDKRSVTLKGLNPKKGEIAIYAIELNKDVVVKAI